jgi:hypothetical protein
MGKMGMDSAELAAAAQRAPGLSLAQALAHSARAAGGALPVLRHLLASDGPSLVSEAVVARVRGMLRDLALQLIAGGGAPPGPADDAAARAVEALAERLGADDALLAHVHTLALESQLAERFAMRLSLDPVLSPLLQELIASDDPAVAELAMMVLAAEARFGQSQRRMALPLGELPADLFHAALQAGAEAGGGTDPAQLAASYDEAATRLGLTRRLVAAMRRAVVACLAFDRAGLALFAEGLAVLTGVPRAGVVLACHEGQAARLALMLRAAGLDRAGIERQLLLISAPGPELREIAELSAEAARARLGESLGAPPPPQERG